MINSNLKLKTIINQIQNDVITNITLEVYGEKKLFEANFEINLRTAILLSFKDYYENKSKCFELIKVELKNKGILFIKYNNIDFNLETFDINF